MDKPAAYVESEPKLSTSAFLITPAGLRATDDRTAGPDGWFREWLSQWPAKPDREPDDPIERARYREHRDALEADLKQIGYAGRGELFASYDLVAIALALAYVKEAKQAGKYVKSQSGLFRWKLEHLYHA